MRPGEEHTRLPFLPIRRAYVDVLDAGRRKNLMHAFVQYDVTAPRAVIAAATARGEARPSFTAFMAHCVATAVSEQPRVQAYRRRRRLIVFEDVDINMQVEAPHAGQQIVRSMILRGVQRMSVAEITAAIRAAQDDAVSRPDRHDARYRGTRAFVAVPRPIRSLVWRVVLANPSWFKRFGGTVSLSAVGMFGGSGGWGLVMTPPSLMVTVGGIDRVPRFVDGRVEERQMLAVTVSFDHAVVDGAPAARFVARLGELVSASDGLVDT